MLVEAIVCWQVRSLVGHYQGRESISINARKEADLYELETLLGQRAQTQAAQRGAWRPATITIVNIAITRQILLEGE